MRIPTHLTDSQLLSELARCARNERGATAQLVAHLAEMDARRLHLGAGFPSLFAYCCEVLLLSESAACKRIEVARMARKYPLVLGLLEDGALSVASARLLAPHVTDENHAELVAAAAGLSQRAVEALVARRFPRPDVAPSIRRLPAPLIAPPSAVPPPSVVTGVASDGVPQPLPPPSRPLMAPLSADRYQVRFTASAATWEKLKVAQDLLRHAVPNGDPAEIFDRALTLLIDALARKKCGTVANPAARQRATAAGSRHVPASVRRDVWLRDRGHCAFVARSGRRCRERSGLEFHHVEPYGVGGKATVANIQLRCRAHNAYESVLFYGESRPGEAGAAAGLSPADSTGRAGS
jgi:hypothetical protein